MHSSGYTSTTTNYYTSIPWCKTNPPTTKAIGARGLTFGGSMQKLVHQSGESDRFWKDGETLNEFLDFSDGKNLFKMSLLALRWRLDHWSFLPVVELGYRAIFSWKVLNLNWLWVSYDVYFFENNVF